MKTFCLLVMLFLLCGTIFGQEKSKSKAVYWGLKAGVNIASQKSRIPGNATSNNPDGLTANHDPITGFYAGLTLNMPFGPKLSFQPEVLFSAQGSKLKEADLHYKIEPATETLHLAYLNIPLAVRYHVAGGLSAELGPQVGVLLKNKTKTNNGPYQDQSKATRSWDLGALVGLEYALPMGLAINVRYVLGLKGINKTRDVNDDGVFDIASQTRITNRVFSAGLAYQFK